MQISNVSTPVTTRPAKVTAANNTAATPAPVKSAKAADGLPNPKDFHVPQWLADQVNSTGGDLKELWAHHKLEAIFVSVVGAFLGWKLDEYAHTVAQRHEGQQFVDDGQQQYLRLRREGTDSLVAALSVKHNFIQNVKDGDFTGESWKTFQSYVVQAETGSNPTFGTYKGQPNMPVVMIALAENPSADSDAIARLAKWLKADLASTPADIKIYQPVVDALKSVHNVSVY